MSKATTGWRPIADPGRGETPSLLLAAELISRSLGPIPTCIFLCIARRGPTSVGELVETVTRDPQGRFRRDLIFADKKNRRRYQEDEEDEPRRPTSDESLIVTVAQICEALQNLFNHELVRAERRSSRVAQRRAWSHVIMDATSDARAVSKNRTKREKQQMLSVNPLNDVLEFVADPNAALRLPYPSLLLPELVSRELDENDGDLARVVLDALLNQGCGTLDYLIEQEKKIDATDEDARVRPSDLQLLSPAEAEKGLVLLVCSGVASLAKTLDGVEPDFEDCKRSEEDSVLKAPCPPFSSSSQVSRVPILMRHVNVLPNATAMSLRPSLGLMTSKSEPGVKLYTKSPSVVYGMNMKKPFSTSLGAAHRATVSREFLRQSTWRVSQGYLARAQFFDHVAFYVGECCRDPLAVEIARVILARGCPMPTTPDGAWIPMSTQPVRRTTILSDVREKLRAALGENGAKAEPRDEREEDRGDRALLLVLDAMEGIGGGKAAAPRVSVLGDRCASSVDKDYEAHAIVLHLHVILARMREGLVKSMVSRSFGFEASNLFGRLLTLGAHEENNLVASELQPPARTRAHIAELAGKSLITCQHVPKRGDNVNPGTTYAVWSVDHPMCVLYFAELLQKSLLNSLVRLSSLDERAVVAAQVHRRLKPIPAKPETPPPAEPPAAKRVKLAGGVEDPSTLSEYEKKKLNYETAFGVLERSIVQTLHHLFVVSDLGAYTELGFGSYAAMQGSSERYFQRGSYALPKTSVYGGAGADAGRRRKVAPKETGRQSSYADSTSSDDFSENELASNAGDDEDEEEDEE